MGRVQRTAVAVGTAAVAALGLAALPSGAAFLDEGSVRTGLTAVPAQPLLLGGGLDAGDDWSLGWDADGVLHAWGSNGSGSLGTGSAGAGELWPTPVAMPDGRRVAEAAAGIDLGIALSVDGGVYTWGNPDIGTNTPVPQRHAFFDALDDAVVGVDAGGYYYLAWTDDGALYSWGNATSRLGRPVESDREPPARVTARGLDRRAVTVAAAGRYHGAAVVDGEVVAWGGGFGDHGGVTLTGLAGDPVLGVSAGTDVTLAWTASGALHSARSAAAAVVPGVAAVVGAAASSPADDEAGFWAWDDDGHLWAWGSNSGGQLGLGTTGGSHEEPQPVPLPPGSAVASVAGGGTHALYDTGSGTFAAAGLNGHGQLGDGTTTARSAFALTVPAVAWP